MGIAHMCSQVKMRIDNMKRIVAVLLVLCTLIGITACSGKAEEAHMIKGEFYNLFLKSFNYYSVDGKNFDETNDYNIEAQAIVDWKLLSEKEAFKGLNKAITKEEAALVCLNSVYIKKQGNADDIKDAKLCKNPQEMANAVATGIVSLDNGYINGKEKLSYQECQDMIENTMQAKINGSFDENQGTIDYAAAENSISFSAADIDDESSFSVEDYPPESSVEIESEDVTSKGSVKATFLSHVNSDKAEIKNIAVNDELFNVKIPKDLYDAKFSEAKKGDYIVYTGNTCLPKVTKLSYENRNKMNTPGYFIEPFVGYLKSVTKVSEKEYNLLLSKPSDEEIMANTDVTQKTIKITNIDFEKKSLKLAGFNISVSPNESKDGVSVSASKTFKLSKNKYGNWRDQKADITAAATASIENMTVTMDNFKHFFRNDNDYAYMKFSSDTTESFELKTGTLRLAPDSNRNGKFKSNLLSSRFTDGQGADSIKITKFTVTVPYTGISFDIGVYLTIQFDGRIKITFSQEGNGFALEKVNGHVKFSALEAEKDKKVDVHTNLDIGVKTEVKINFLFVSNVLSGYLTIGMDISAVFSAFTTENDKTTKTATGYYNYELAKSDSKLKFCFDICGKMYISGGLENNNLIGKMLKKHYDLSKLSFTIKGNDPDGGLSLSEFSLHIEESGKVSECTRKNAENSAENDEDKKAVSEGKFLLESTKLTVVDGTCNTIKITGMPISTKKISKKYPSGIQVRVKDKTIAEAVYSEKTNNIVVSSLKPGSTEVEVYVQKNKKKGKEYMQTFSVTISENSDIEYTSFIADDLTYAESLSI